VPSKWRIKSNYDQDEEGKIGGEEWERRRNDSINGIELEYGRYEGTASINATVFSLVSSDRFQSFLLFTLDPTSFIRIYFPFYIYLPPSIVSDRISSLRSVTTKYHQPSVPHMRRSMG
jgi:hypothetical protein